MLVNFGIKYRKFKLLIIHEQEEEIRLHLIDKIEISNDNSSMRMLDFKYYN